MKKFLSAFICVFTLMTAAASAEFANPALVDNAGFLTAEEAAEINQRLDQTRNEYNIDIAVYTETDMSGDTAEATADDIYDYNSYGTGENDDGMILYISQNPRMYHFSTCGKGIEIFGKSELDDIEGDILPYLKDNDYYTALLVYAEDADNILMWGNDAASSEDIELTPSDFAVVAFFILIFSLIVALIATLIRAGRMKTAVNNNYAANYMKNMNLTQSEDIFLYSTVTRTEKPKPEPETETHVSSSGRTHGGQGGSY